MNAAKRKRKSREKLKSDESKWKTAQENQKKYDQKRREKGKALRESNEKSMIQWREKERLRKRKQREKKKLDGIMKTCDSPLGSYKTINTLKKAVVKLKKALPESPNKKTAVLIHVLKETVPMSTAKQTLCSAIMTRKAVLDTSFDCYKYLAANAPGLKVFFVAIGDIKLVQVSLDERWQRIIPIPFTQKHHHFKCHNKSIKYALTGTSQDMKKVLLIQDGKLKYSDVYSSDDECKC